MPVDAQATAAASGPALLVFNANATQNAIGAQDPAVPPLPLPVVTAHPQSVTVSEGQDFTFAASATDAASVFWVASDDGGLNWFEVTGETSESITFTASVEDDGVQFMAVFEGAGGARQRRGERRLGAEHRRRQLGPVQFTEEQSGPRAGGPSFGSTATFEMYDVDMRDNGVMFRAVVTNARGERAVSDAARLTVVEQLGTPRPQPTPTTATGTGTPKGKGAHLAQTGASSVGTLIAVGAGLVLVGTGVVVAIRRKQRAA